MRILLKRVYDAVDEKGYRVLVDRIWPRGISKEKLAADEWCREIAPSTRLRKWFGHDPDKWEPFREKYLKELEAKRELLERLRKIARKKNLVLLYSAKDPQKNQAVIICEALKETSGGSESA